MLPRRLLFSLCVVFSTLLTSLSAQQNRVTHNKRLKKTPTRKLQLSIDIDQQQAKFLDALILKRQLRDRKEVDLLNQFVKRNFTLNQAVLGGEKAESGMFPWQVGIFSKKYQFKSCGGALISVNWIVTAAHCFAIGEDPNNIRIFVGSVNLPDGSSNSSGDLSLQDGEFVSAKRICIHPNWRGGFDSDIALIEVEANKGTPVKPPLSESEESGLISPSKEAVVSGWGYIDATGGDSPPTVLRWVDVPFVSRKTCADSGSSSEAITDNMLCAGATGKDACLGDSGGPLVAPYLHPMVEDPLREQVKIVGIVGVGDGCGQPGKYGIYTRVFKFLDWIENATKSEAGKVLECK